MEELSSACRCFANSILKCYFFKGIPLNWMVQKMPVSVSLENRIRISFALFFVLDNFAWYYFDFFERVTFFYTVLSQCVHFSALLGLIDTFIWKKYYYNASYVMFTYCFLMIPFSMLAGQSYGFLGNLAPNFFYIKKYMEHGIDHPVLAVLFYAYFLVVVYLYCWKHIKNTNRRP